METIGANMTINTTVVTCRYRMIYPFILTSKLSMIMRHARFNEHSSMNRHSLRNRSNFINTQIRHDRSQTE
jgi:hypothetical protein